MARAAIQRQAFKYMAIKRSIPSSIAAARAGCCAGAMTRTIVQGDTIGRAAITVDVPSRITDAGFLRRTFSVKRTVIKGSTEFKDK